MEFRWYVRGWIIVFDTAQGRQRGCLGLTGLGNRTLAQVDEIAETLSVPRTDRWR